MLAGAPMSMLLRWQSFYEIDPFGQEREDIRVASICLAVSNAAGVKKKGGGKLTLQDFMLDFKKQPTTTELDPITAQAVMRDRYGKK